MNKDILNYAKNQALEMIEEVQGTQLFSEDKELFCFLMDQAIQNIDRQLLSD